METEFKKNVTFKINTFQFDYWEEIMQSDILIFDSHLSNRLLIIKLQP